MKLSRRHPVSFDAAHPVDEGLAVRVEASAAFCQEPIVR